MKLKKRKTFFKSNAYDDRHYLELHFSGISLGTGSLEAVPKTA